MDQLPEKYETQCGAGGAHLSGGQKQRVALARALLRDPAVLILDEATSALDSKSEKTVQKALDEVLQSRRSTTLVVAHRLTTIQGVDEIIVLDNRGEGAEVVQRGSHEELLQNTQGLYYHLFNAQTEGGDEKKAPRGNKAHAAAAADEVTATGVVSSGEGTGAKAGVDDDDVAEVVAVAESASEGSAAALDVLESAVGLRTPSLLARLRRKTLPPTQQNTARLSRVVKMLAPDWLPFLLMVLCSGISGACFPLLGLMLGHFLSVLFKPDAQEVRDQTDFWSLMLLIYVLARFPIEFIKQAVKEYLSARVSRQLRMKAFDNLVHQDVGFFDSPQNSTGTLAAVLGGEVSVVTTAATGNFVSLFHALACIFVGVAIGFLSCWRLALVLLATFMLSAVAVGMEHKLGRPSFNAAGGSSKKKRVDSASGVFAEAVQGIRVVMSFGLEEHFAALYSKAATSDLDRKVRAAAIAGVSWGFAQSMQFFVFSLALWYGGRLADDGVASPQDIMNTVFPIIFAASGLGIAVIYSTDAKRAKRALADVFRVIDRKSLIDIRDSGCRGCMLEDFQGALDFERVAFCYPLRPEQRVYRDLSFSVAPGESVALVGASGCGKSTAVQLLLRFYDLQSSTQLPLDEKPKAGRTPHNAGRICADSTNIQDVNLTRFRSLVGLVSQEPVLFNLTIAENIKYSKPDATQVRTGGLISSCPLMSVDVVACAH